MPLPPDLFDLAPPWAQNSRALFLLSFILSMGLTFIGWLGNLAQTTQDLPPNFLGTCIYALAGSRAIMAGSGAMAVKWIATKALRIISDHTKSNSSLIKEIQALRQIQEVQMQYFNSVGIAALEQAIADKENTDLAELPAELPASNRQQKTRR